MSVYVHTPVHVFLSLLMNVMTLKDHVRSKGSSYFVKGTCWERIPAKWNPNEVKPQWSERDILFYVLQGCKAHWNWVHLQKPISATSQHSPAHATCQGLQHSFPTSKMPLKVPVLKPRFQAGQTICSGALVNKSQPWGTQEHQNLPTGPCWSVKTTTKDKRRPSSFVPHPGQQLLPPLPSALLQRDMWPMGTWRCHQQPWLQPQGTPGARLYCPACLGFVTSKIAAKDLLKNPLDSFFRESILARNHLVQNQIYLLCYFGENT